MIGVDDFVYLENRDSTLFGRRVVGKGDGF